MKPLSKKVFASFLLIIGGLLIEYLNDAGPMIGAIVIVLPIALAVSLVLVIGIFWNEKKSSCRVRQPDETIELDAETHLKRRYVLGEVSDEEFTRKMSRL